MRLNEHLQLVGTNVILVPYEAKHVQKYHRWMQSEELQELTASEPLTLEQEYAMQQSWREDEDSKISFCLCFWRNIVNCDIICLSECTFLILDKAIFNQTGDEIAALIGDTNIFLLPPDDDGDDDLKTGEIEIMIAEQPARGKRYGWESTLLMLAFGAKKLAIRRFRAITKDSNAKAIRMFTKMDFREVKRVAVFQEVTFEKQVDAAWLEWIEREVSLVIEPYRNEWSDVCWKITFITCKSALGAARVEFSLLQLASLH